MLKVKLGKYYVLLLWLFHTIGFSHRIDPIALDIIEFTKDKRRSLMKLPYKIRITLKKLCVNIE